MVSAATRRYLALTFCFLERILFAGALYHWPSLVYVLQVDGVYSHLCSEANNTSATGNNSMIDDSLSNSTNICTAQKVRLSLGYTIAILAGIGTIVTGWIFDKWGLLSVRDIATACGVASFLCFGFVNEGTDWLVFPGAFLLGLSCFTVMMTTNHLSILARSRASMVVGLFNGALTLSWVFQCVKLAHDNGISRRYSFLFLSAVWIIFFLLSSIYLPRFKANRDGEFLTKAEQITQEQISTESEIKPKFRYELWKEFKQYIFGLRFILFCFFFSCLHVRIADIGTSYNAWISSIVEGNKTKVSYYTDVLAYTSMAVVPTCFIPGLISDYLRKIWRSDDSDAMFCVPVLTAISILAVATCIPFYIKTEYSIYICVIVYSFFMQTFFVGIGPFYSLVLPIHIFGMLFALLEAISGLAALFIYLYTMWTVDSNSYIPVTTYHLILSLLTFSLPIKIIWDWKQRKSKISDFNNLDHIINRSTSL